jgi:hypothetical protein
VTASTGGQGRPVSDPAIAVLASQVEGLTRTVAQVEETANTAVRTATAAKDRSAVVAEQLVELVRQVAGLAAVGTQVGILADRVAELAAGQGGGGDGEAAGQVSWYDVDGEQAAAMLVDLARWVYDVLSHYRTAMQQFSDCWRRHPSVVEGLLALRSAWCAAYRDPEARPTAAVDWHIRQLPGVVELLRDELRGCSELNHGPDGDVERWRRSHPRVPPNDDRLVEYADWWVAHNDPDQEQGPEPGLPEPRTPDHGQSYGTPRPGTSQW